MKHSIRASAAKAGASGCGIGGALGCVCNVLINISAVAGQSCF